MKIAVIGTGYVGLVTGACLAEKGNHVINCDIDEDKIRLLSQGEVPIQERGLEHILRQVTKSDGDVPFLRFTNDHRYAISESDIIFCAVGTPFIDGFIDTRAVKKVASAVREYSKGSKILAIKSTVPVGTTREIQASFEGLEARIYVVSNPEFLVEGNAVEDTKRPDRIIIGSDHIGDVKHVFDELYAPFLRRSGSGVMHMDPNSAELSKLTANAYLAMRISFINEIANFAESAGANIDEVRRGAGSDKRIGMHYLFAGQGYGGSCFPKDLPTLVAQMSKIGLVPFVLRGVHDRNNSQKMVLARKVIKRFGDERGSLKRRTFGMWGLAFKADTDDVRESPALTAIKLLHDKGAKILAYDPSAGLNAMKELDKIADDGGFVVMDNQYSVIDHSDALIICTEWDQFRSPDFDRIKRGLKTPVIFDGRNLYDPNSMEMRGFEYYSIGRRQVVA